jgi:hypothetical protein
MEGPHASHPQRAKRTAAFSRLLVAGCLSAAMLSMLSEVRASTYFVGVEGHGNLSATHPVELSGSGSAQVGINQTGFISNQGFAAAAIQTAGASSFEQSNFSSSPIGSFGGQYTFAQTSANFLSDGLVISGPPGQILISFNVNVTGSIDASGNGGVESFASATAQYSLGDSHGGGAYLGSISVNDAGITAQSAIFGSFGPTADNYVGTATTAQIVYDIGDPCLSFGLQIDTNASSDAFNEIGPGSGFAFSNFCHSLSFPTSGPVANLPPGYTLNSLDGTIVDNHFVPEATFSTGDFNRADHVNAADIVAMMAAMANLSGYQTTNGLSASQLLAIGNFNSGGSISNVPEPSTFVLAFIACGILL